MNTKLYKQVYSLAADLLEAAQSGDDNRFEQRYQLLKKLCYENETNSDLNHPVQWETLADFTEDTGEALALYEKALGFATAIDARDYMASINYAVAVLLIEDKSLDSGGDKAMAAASRANECAANIEDSELRDEITALLKKLKH